MVPIKTLLALVDVNVTVAGDAESIQWAHRGRDLSRVCYFTPKGCSPCHSDTGSNNHRVASYPTDLQTTKAH